MEHSVLNHQGLESKKIKLGNAFTLEGKDQTIFDKIRNELANKRQGTASTKTRGMVRGGGKKPWRQKGTGRARAGSNRSPIWVGGGTVFGPQPRDYSYAMPKKVRRLALAATISRRVRQGVVSIVENFTFESGKTRDAVQFLDKFRKNNEYRVLLIHHEDDMMLKRALRNIPWLRFMHAKRLSVHEIFYAQQILLMEGAIADIENQFDLIKGK
jgi:large subunit ribosomal protein L4